VIEAPQSFVIRQECDKAAFDHGFRRAHGETDGWRRYSSTTAQGELWLAAAGAEGPWYLALDHSGVIAELGQPPADMAGPGLARLAFDTLGALYEVMPRVYQLSVSLPEAPLDAFREKVKNLPQGTEAERLVVQRVGQDIFRASLMEYWQGRCPLTGIADAALLRASHIIPWKLCETDAERLNVHNGLLLSALWDAAFDKGLVSFDDEGRPMFSPGLSEDARAELRWHAPIPLGPEHHKRLAWHRETLFQQSIR